MLVRNELGQIVKNSASPIAEAEPTNDPDVLAEYREQAAALESALKAVKTAQQNIVETTKARESALGARQTLIDKAAAADDEAAVEELSRISSRGEVLAARLTAHEHRLGHAQAELKAAMATFGISYNALFLTLRTFLVRDAAARIAAMLHPSVRQISAGSIAEVAPLATEVINLAPFGINVEPGITGFDSLLPPENVQRAAEQSLQKTEPLLDVAAKYLEDGFQPPQAFSLKRWRASVSPGVPVAA
jgi:hypothetical protein